MSSINIFWFRRDLRIHDNHGFYKALSSGAAVLPIFIFDTDILNDLEKEDARLEFIHNAIKVIKGELEKTGSSLRIYHGKPLEVFKDLLNEYQVQEVYTNHDYEPYAINRDQEILKFLKSKNIEFKTFKDQVIFERDEILTGAGTAFKVYTPYKNRWLEKFPAVSNLNFPSEKNLKALFKTKQFHFPSLTELGFEKTGIALPDAKPNVAALKNYDKERDFPSLNGTSRLGVHLRFGTISVREWTRIAQQTNAVWLSEFIWREFFMQILYHFPQVTEKPFNQSFRNFQWRHSEKDFEKWKSGETGYPLVDAGMRELNTTGYMHNRVRMVTASFLTKHLLLDYKWGEAYFAQKLLDFELASNNGNWQWAAGTGADAQPFIRIFNPYLQQERFDKEFHYIKKWVPEFNTPSYPAAMIDHKVATTRAKEVFLKMGK